VTSVTDRDDRDGRVVSLGGSLAAGIGGEGRGEAAATHR
jgi:hypothetical protein